MSRGSPTFTDRSRAMFLPLIIDPKSHPSVRAREKVPDRAGDFVAVCLEREVPRVEELDLCALDVALEGLRPGRQEERVCVAPHGQERRLVLAEVALERREIGRAS